MQGKILFKPLDTNSWGIGLAAGTLRHLQNNGESRDWYAYIPSSFSFHDDDATIVHANLGWLREGGARRDIDCSDDSYPYR
jgi:hypothetical protein